MKLFDKRNWIAALSPVALAGCGDSDDERFRPSGTSAAHRTLPLSSHVEVTALRTGRTIPVRVDDCGPFAGNRIIDLSVGAAIGDCRTGDGTGPGAADPAHGR